MWSAPAFSRRESSVGAIEQSNADAQQRYEEIVELLLAAGYFRARIATLSPFDKVVGGMAWCMTATSVDVDVAFEENATIGQKIKIGEGIERALRQMKCRIPLQAHQIQGLDYAAIFPVVQWLVKQAYAFREEIAEATRRLSISNFCRHFELPEDAELARRRRKALPTAARLCAPYVPARRFRPRQQQQQQQQQPARVSTPAVHARRVLMEYGARLPTYIPTDDETGASAGTSNKAKAAAQLQAEAAAASAAAAAAEAKAAAGEMAEVADASSAASDVNQSRIGKLVKLGASEIKEAALSFAQKSSALAQSGEMAAAHRLRAEREGAAKQLEAAKHKLQREGAKAREAEQALETLRTQRAAAQSEVAAHLSARAESEKAMAELEVLAEGADQGELSRLQALLALTERQASQKAEFKRECAKQMRQMQLELEELRRERSAEDDDEEAAKLAEIERLHAGETAKAEQMRRLVGQKGRESMLLARQLDDVPSAAELMQYERRFRELYSQVASKLDETRRYYALYNTLEEKKGYLSKEVSLLNSIHETFTKASGSKDKIADSIESLLKSVQQSVAKVEQRLHDELATRNETQAKYDKLVETQRKYFQLVKSYQIECQKNEELAATMAAAAADTGGGAPPL